MGGFTLILAVAFVGAPAAARPCWDLDGDGATGHSDLAIPLTHWGEGCP